MAIEMTVRIETHVTVTIEDILGDQVQPLVDEILMAGQYRFSWLGTDSHGVHMPSGRYTVRMVAYDPDGTGILFEDTTDILMCLFDPVGDPIATSDENGWFVLGDMRHFPHMFDREPMRAYDEIRDGSGRVAAHGVHARVAGRHQRDHAAGHHGDSRIRFLQRDLGSVESGGAGPGGQGNGDAKGYRDSAGGVETGAGLPEPLQLA